MTLTRTILLQLLTYDPTTGVLRWKHRPEHFFPTYKSYRQWNGAWEGKEAFTAVDRKGYRVGAVFNKLYKAHRIIWCMVHDTWPDQIDHEDGVKSNNRLSNLNDVSNRINHRNMGIQKNNNSGVTGVNWVRREGKWRARITVDGVDIALGYFSDFNAAVAVRKQAEIEYDFHPNHGDRVRCQS